MKWRTSTINNFASQITLTLIIFLIRFKKQQKAKETERKETHRKNVENRKKAAASNSGAQPKPEAKVPKALVKDSRFETIDTERFAKKKKGTAGPSQAGPLPAGLKRKLPANKAKPNQSSKTQKKTMKSTK